MSGGKNKLFMENPIAFMKNYSVCPADDIGMYIGDKAVSMNTRAATGYDYVYSNIDAAKSVAWLNFSKKARGTGVNLTFIPKAEGVISVDGSYTPQAGKVKSYFLPWTAGGGIIKVSIPQRGTVPAAQDADYFFTATITGCSIFIKGTAQAPVVYHAGGDTKQSDPLQAAQFWRNLMTTYSGAGALVEEVNKTHYISDPTATKKGTNTPNSETFEAWLNNNKPADLDISMVFPWGCVMGLRDAAGNWKFYLQENATILFTKWKKKNILSKQKVQSTMTGASRPMIFREIFPNGGMHHVFLPQLPRKL
jgi:hypothetical protein